MSGKKTLNELLQRSLLKPPQPLNGVPHYDKALTQIKEYCDERETAMKHHIKAIADAGRRGDLSVINDKENALYDSLEKLLNNFECAAEYFVTAARKP